jgi:glucose/arabinose dehydrogenase
MARRRTTAVAAAALALVATTVAGTVGQADAHVGVAGRARLAPGVTLPVGFHDALAIGGLSQPVGIAFAPDGTAFLGEQTGIIKSFDHDSTTGQFESPATQTTFADLSLEVDNYGDRGLTGITVDPQFPARPYVYVNYTLNADPQQPTTIPAWGDGGAYDNCGPDDANEATLVPPTRGCPVLDRVSRLTAEKTALGWTMVPGSEHVLVTSGCAQFSSHSSGDVAFGPDGKLYASAGDGGSFKGNDYGQANGSVPNKACPDDPVNQGGALRAQDQRTASPTDPLGIDGTIFRMNPDTGLAPDQASADVGGSNSWLVAMGQRNPWRFTFRQGGAQLWSVDVGSSNWEEINRLVDAPTAALTNRGWPCYEGVTGSSQVNPNWATFNASSICQDLYAAGTGAVQAPVFAYPTTNATRTATVPLTPGENCPAVSSAMSGIAFSALGSSWPGEFQDSLFFSDYLRGCIWRMQKDANGQPDPSRVQVFAQSAGAPVDIAAGPGGDLYYVDYGSFTASGYVEGSGGVHRISYPGSTGLTVKSSPKKVKIKVDGKRQRAPYRTSFDIGRTVKLVAPKVFVKKGVRYLFKQWKGVSGKKAKKKHKLSLAIGLDDLTVKAVYQRVRSHGTS